jgi:hypothetical protein
LLLLLQELWAMLHSASSNESGVQTHLSNVLLWLPVLTVLVAAAVAGAVGHAAQRQQQREWRAAAAAGRKAAGAAREARARGSNTGAAIAHKHIRCLHSCISLPVLAVSQDAVNALYAVCTAALFCLCWLRLRVL